MSLSGFDGGEGALEPCYSCGHLRSSHLDHTCQASVSTMPDVQSWHRDPCSCSGYFPDDGQGRWGFDGKRLT